MACLDESQVSLLMKEEEDQEKEDKGSEKEEEEEGEAEAEGAGGDEEGTTLTRFELSCFLGCWVTSTIASCA